MKIVINKVAPITAPLQVDRVDFEFVGTTVFADLTLSIQPGALTVLAGPNGCGKSTLLGLLAGVLRPRAGRVSVGVDDIAFAVQRSEVTDSFPITVTEAVMMGRWRHLGLLRRPGASDRNVVEHWLEAMNLIELRTRTLGELSGGQRQRVLLAQAFAQQAPLLLLDEPTTGLDSASATRLIGQLRELVGQGTTVIAASHDQALIAAADTVIRLGTN